jgi:hypothetical protein
MLLGFQKEKVELTKPIPIAIGQIAGFKYVTSVPSHEGESGAPWIDLRTGKVFAVASVIRYGPVGPSYEATPVTLIRRLLSSYTNEDPDVIDRPASPEEAAPPPASLKQAAPPPALAKPPGAQESSLAKPPGAPQASSNFVLASFDVIYFSRPRDKGIVEELLNKQKIKWRRQPGETLDPTNVVTCAGQNSLNGAKWLVGLLLDAGVGIRGIAPQRTPIGNKITIEQYQEYTNQPLLTKDRLLRIQRCPDWSEILSSSITVKNGCSYGFLDVYLRYFHPSTERWVTSARYGLGPLERWTVLDDDGSPVGSGRPYVLAYALDSYSPESAGLPGRQARMLDAIPTDYFFRTQPSVTWGCPKAGN